MASEISHRHSVTGATVYFNIRAVDHRMWSVVTSNFESLLVSNWGNYAIAMPETPASSYLYVGTFPPIGGNMIAGVYWVDMFTRVGASPAISDSIIASYWGYWNGTTFKWWASDTTHLSGALQTARDIGASVLVSPGSAVGQLDVTAGVVKTNLVQILATALTESGVGYLATAFRTLLDVAVPVLTAASVNQTGDAYVPVLITLDSVCLVNTRILSLVSQTQFNLVDGSDNDDAYNGLVIVVESASVATRKCWGTIRDYAGMTKTVFLDANPGVFIMAATDRVKILPRDVSRIYFSA